MDGDGVLMEEEDDCPDLVPIETPPAPPAPPAEQIPVTIITGYLGERSLILTQFMKEIIVSLY